MLSFDIGEIHELAHYSGLIIRIIYMGNFSVRIFDLLITSSLRNVSIPDCESRYETTVEDAEKKSFLESLIRLSGEMI